VFVHPGKSGELLDWDGRSGESGPEYSGNGSASRVIVKRLFWANALLATNVVIIEVSEVDDHPGKRDTMVEKFSVEWQEALVALDRRDDKNNEIVLAPERQVEKCLTILKTWKLEWLRR